ncbi:MAG: AzlD domain-containing protein [Casimicrobium sp.]
MNTIFWGTTEGWIAVAGLSIGTFLIRYSFIGLLAGKKLPPRIERALQLAVPAIFAAIVIPLVIMTSGRIDVGLRWPHAVAAIVTGVIAWWRGGMMLPIAAGMVTLYGLQYFAKW